MRLIDADALVETFEKNARIAARFGSNAPAFRYLELAFAVNNAPTVDAVPVRRGKWLHPEEGDEDYSLVGCSCSVCGWKFNLYEDDIDGAPYCAMCGARMEPVAPWYQVEGEAEGGKV